MIRTQVRQVCLVLCSAVAVFALTSCGGESQQPEALTGDYSGTGPGTLRAAVKLSNVDERLSAASSLAARITYVSTSGIDQRQHDVTGTVFVPRGPVPDGGWPIVAFGHAPTGIGHDCAPSMSPTLNGSLKTVAALLDAGYVVAVPDYQGLGLGQTYYPYLDATTSGLNLIDSVRATRKFVPDASQRFVTFGVSEGGQAAWAADELMGQAPPGLQLMGALGVSPAADISELADAAAAGELSRDQKYALAAYLASLKSEHHDLNLDDFRSGSAVTKWTDLLACRDRNDPHVSQDVNDPVPGGDLRPRTPEAVETLRGFLQASSLPQKPTVAPLLVIYDDAQPRIPQAWTDRAVAQACLLGDVVDVMHQPQILGLAEPSDGGGVDMAGPIALGWIKDRFDGVPMRNGCPPRTAPEDG